MILLFYSLIPSLIFGPGPSLQRIMLQGPRINNGSDAVSLLHRLKSTVNLSKSLAVCDELINLESSRHVVADKSRQLRAALDAAKSAALPDTTSDKLECCKRNSS